MWAGLLLLTGCSTPIQVERVDPASVQRDLSRNVLSTGTLSDPTRIVLDRRDLSERFATDPEGAIAVLHRSIAADKADQNILFALAEMSFRYADDTARRGYHLAAAVYAFAFPFPDDPAQRACGGTSGALRAMTLVGTV